MQGRRELAFVGQVVELVGGYAAKYGQGMKKPRWWAGLYFLASCNPSICYTVSEFLYTGLLLSE